ncbi:hypothetical protein OSB04_029970 [Centaurea solstitialis]|uniref:DUF1764-domain-containing protein n=1 Tax=Centaurea solstitialis TaxID=347529 RepID=A0AA38SQ75_9ASTR|nr:hypothetical protein OSB04_029970 [Centaurea solstitialis]
MPKKRSSKTSKPVQPSPAIASWDMPKKSSSKTSKPVQPTPTAIATWDMPKKNSSKKTPSKKTPSKPVSKSLVKPSSTSKTFGHEIEEIFSKKRKKPENEKTRKVAAEGSVEKQNKLDEEMVKDSKKENGRKKRSKSGGSNVDMFEKEQAARPKRKTADGLAIYSEEDLGIGRANAGGTRLCPFDCDCCF